MIFNILCSILLASTSFNAGMIFYKRYDTEKRIKQKYEDMGYQVDENKIKNLFSYDIDEYYDSNSLNQMLYEVIGFLPILNIINSKYNMEYLMGNYEHNKYFENIVNKSTESFMLYNGFIKENDSSDINDDLMNNILLQAKNKVDNEIDEEIKNINQNNKEFNKETDILVSKNDEIELLKRKKELIEALIEIKEVDNTKTYKKEVKR